MDTGKRSLITAFLLAGCLFLFIDSGVRWNLPAQDQPAVLWPVLWGVLLLVCGVFFLRDDKRYSWLNERLQSIGTWFGISPLQVFLLITSPLFAALAIHAAGFGIRMRAPYVAVTAWLLGIGLALVGSWKPREEKTRLSKAVLFWFVLVMFPAFLFRGIATGQFPILLTGDEASAGFNAIQFVRGQWNNPFITGWFSFPSFFPFLQSLSVRIFGNTIEALRIPSALAGTLTVGVVYLCGRSMFGQRAGIFAALILAVLHFHIHFSRLGLNNIWDGLWFTLTIGALWLGWKTQARWAWLLAGLGLGISQYFYATSKALMGIVFVAALLAFCFRRARFRQMLPDICAALIVALAVVSPLAWYYVNEPGELLAPFVRASRLEEITSSGVSFWSFVFRQLPVSLGAYTHTQFTDFSFWYAPETPVLRSLAAMFFYIGIIFLIIHDRDSRLTLLTLWLVALALSNALSATMPAAQRYVAAVPACALVAGYGLHKIAERLAALWSRSRRIVSAMAYIILIGIAVSDLWFYFVDYTGSISMVEMTSNGMLAHQFGSYLKDQPAGTQVVFFGSPRLGYDSPAVRYLAPHIQGMNAPEDWETFDRNQLTSSKVIFVFPPEDRDSLEMIQEEYPGGSLTVEKAWNDDVLYWTYEHVAIQK